MSHQQSSRATNFAGQLDDQVANLAVDRRFLVSLVKLELAGGEPRLAQVSLNSLGNLRFFAALAADCHQLDDQIEWVGQGSFSRLTLCLRWSRRSGTPVLRSWHFVRRGGVVELGYEGIPISRVRPIACFMRFVPVDDSANLTGSRHLGLLRPVRFVS